MKDINFETSMENLEQIVQELEKGDLNLDDSIKKFEEGMRSFLSGRSLSGEGAFFSQEFKLLL